MPASGNSVASDTRIALPVAVAATSFDVPVARLYTRRALKFMVVLGAMGLAYFALVNTWLVTRQSG